MNNFKPPTDNLYKFLALAGLVTLGYALYFFESSIVDLQIELFEIDTKSKLLNVDLEKLEKNSDKIENIQKIDQEYFDCIESQTWSNVDEQKEVFNSCLSDKPSSHEDVMERYHRINKMLGMHYEKSIEIKRKIILIDGEGKKYNAILARHERFTSVLHLIIYVGFFLTVMGFYYWYTRVQRPQDKLFKKELSG